MRGSLQRAVSELTDESMRAATLVGLLAIPTGLLWIVLFGTGSASVVLLAGALVGAIYSDRPTRGYRAGARAGLFAPLPEAVVQSAAGVGTFLGTSMTVEAKVAFAVLAGAIGFLFLWVVGAFLCLTSAAVSEAIVSFVRPYLSDSVDRAW